VNIKCYETPIMSFYPVFIGSCILELSSGTPSEGEESSTPI